MFTVTRQIYNTTMKYLSKNGLLYKSYDLFELCEYDPEIPEEIKQWSENDDYFEWAQCQLEVILAKHELKEAQKQLDKKNKNLMNSEKNIHFTN